MSLCIFVVSRLAVGVETGRAVHSQPRTRAETGREAVGTSAGREGGKRKEERRKWREGMLWPFSDSPHGPHGTAGFVFGPGYRVLHAPHIAPHIAPTLSVSSLRTAAHMEMFLER